VRAWLDRLAVREQLVLLLGAAALAVALVYTLAWEPFAERHARLGQVVAEQQALLAWMETAVAELRTQRERGAAPGAQVPEGQSLLATVDAASRAAGLAANVSRIQPEGAATVRVWMEKAPFDAVVGWLVRLEGDAAVEVESIAVEAAEGAGLVNVRLGLTRAGEG
jgi:general secretion pathway protein M